MAHPAKMMRQANGDVPPPKGYDISGSAAWFAKADHGITVHRPDPVHSLVSEIHSWKCRFSWLGRQGTAELLYSTITNTYVEVGDDPFANIVPVDDPFAGIGPAPMDKDEDNDFPF